MSTILLIETATEVCSVAISKGEHILAHLTAEKDYTHSEQLTILIKKCAEKANIQLKDLTAVAVSKGPGSYTALRVGTSTAKGICYALDLPLIAVDTLEALAQAGVQKVKDENALYCSMIDARRMEVYTALFDSKLNCLIETQPLVVKEDSFNSYFRQEQRIIFVGNGAEKCKSTLTNSFARFEEIICDAIHLALLAQQAYEQKAFEDVAYYVPTYGKAPNITTPKKRL